MESKKRKNPGFLYDYIRMKSKEWPNQTAILSGGDRISYHQMMEMSDRLGASLYRMGVRPGDCVGVMTGRTPSFLYAVLGLWSIGACFLPIDTVYPPERISYMLENSAANLLLTDSGNTEVVFAGKTIAVSTLLLNGSTVPPDCRPSGDGLAYILYTSGSTGRPKGVKVTLRNITNYISWASRYYLKGQKASFPLYSSISFDLTMTSVFTPLTVGGAVILFPDDKPDIIREVVVHPEVDIVKLTPTHMGMLGEKQIAVSRVQVMIVGGEDLKAKTAARIHTLSMGRISIYNEYGPTEATVGCMIHKFSPQEDTGESVPIGNAISNTQVYLLNNQLKPVPVGAQGEIYVSGAGVAQGYCNLKKETAERFLQNPFQSGKRMYKTGDLARWLPGKKMEYIGRIDAQIKLRGYRVELGEIESTLMKLDHVREAAVVIEGEGEQRRLVGFAVLQNYQDSETLKQELSRYLPDYMIPDVIQAIDEIPANQNGKADRDALSSMIVQTTSEQHQAPDSEIERELVKIWQEILRKETVGITDNFFDLGGNSLLLVKMQSLLEERLGITVSASKLFAYPTIRSFLRSGLDDNPTGAFPPPAATKLVYDMSAMAGAAEVDSFHFEGIQGYANDSVSDLIGAFLYALYQYLETGGIGLQFILPAEKECHSIQVDFHEFENLPQLFEQVDQALSEPEKTVCSLPLPSDNETRELYTLFHLSEQMPDNELSDSFHLVVHVDPAELKVTASGRDAETSGMSRQLLRVYQDTLKEIFDA